MITKVESSLVLPSMESKQAAATTENAWEKYARDIEKLKADPPKMYAVTISEFQMGDMRFPTWQIPDFTKSGFTSLPPATDRRIVVTEKYLKILQKEVPGYLRDIVEVDPITEQPLTLAKNEETLKPSQQTSTLSSLLSSKLASTTGNTPLSQTTTTRNSPAPAAAKVAQLRKKEEQQELPETQAFDFTKLTPKAQETAVRLAEQLFTAALRQLRGSDQSTSDISSLLNRTA